MEPVITASGSGEVIFTALTERYHVRGDHARHLLETAAEWGVSTSPEPRGYLEITRTGRAKFTLEEKFLAKYRVKKES
jgi:hypothetical protein